MAPGIKKKESHLHTNRYQPIHLKKATTEKFRIYEKKPIGITDDESAVILAVRQTLLVYINSTWVKRKI